MRKLFALLLLATGVSMATANQQSGSLERLARLVMSTEGDRAAVNASADEAATEIATTENSEQRSLLESQRLFYLGMWALSLDDRSEADAFFSRSLEHAEQALSLAESAAAHRSISNALQQLLGLRGVFFQVAEAGRALASARRAVELDRSSAQARMSLVSFLASAPPIAGGDRREAARQLDRAQMLAGDSQNLHFLVLVWRARLNALSGDGNAARSALAAAREIYPRSWLLRETETDIRRDLENL